MKLETLKSVEMKAIEIPATIPVPPFADATKLRDRIFGAVCRINPELACMEDENFLKRVFVCIKAANDDKEAEMMYQPQQGVSYVKYMKENSVVQKWRKWYADEKERKNAYNREHKEEKKKLNEERKAKYGTVLINGIEEPLASWTLEPEGIFFGRGESPLNGFWKMGTQPEEVRVNTNSKNLPVLIKDEKEEQFAWNVDWNPDAHFAAQYLIRVGIPHADGSFEQKACKYKMIQFASTSSVKKEGQEKKYAAGAELGRSYGKILAEVEKQFAEARKSGKPADTAVAVYMLFEKGIRIGFAEATVNNTKGLLALEWGKDVKRSGNKIKFDFFGKDSVHDVSFIESDYADVIEATWKAHKKLATDKGQIKAFVGAIVPTLEGIFSPKLARTAVAAYTAQKALDEVTSELKVTKESTLALKKLALDEATMRVARRLNHQRGVNRAAEEKRKAKFAESETKLDERKAKVAEQIAKKEARVAKLKEKKGNRDKIKLLKEQIANAKTKLKEAEMNLEAKERNANFTGSTAKNSYIDPSIVADWCRKVDMPIEKAYTKAQLVQFENFLK